MGSRYEWLSCKKKKTSKQQEKTKEGNLLDDGNELLQNVLSSLGHDDCSSQVAEQVRARCLDGLLVAILSANDELTIAIRPTIPGVQKHLHKALAALGVVKVHKEAPCEQPGPLLECD